MSNFAQFRCVLVFGAEFDPAIDTDKMFAHDADGNLAEDAPARKYIATRDESYVILHENKLPVWFVLKPIEARALNRLVADLNRATPDELWMLAQHCLRNVENCSDFSFELSDFKVVGPNDETKLTDAGMQRFAEHFGLLAVRELGDVVLKRTAIPRRKVASFLSQGG